MSTPRLVRQIRGQAFVFQITADSAVSQCVLCLVLLWQRVRPQLTLHRILRIFNPLSISRLGPKEIAFLFLSFPDGFLLSFFLRLRERIEEVGKKIKREADAVTDRTGRRLSLVGTINTITPCAACKLLRRRCAQDCPFAPYFSPHEPQRFASVHKVFGASNISKMLLVYDSDLKNFHSC